MLIDNTNICSAIKTPCLKTGPTSRLAARSSKELLVGFIFGTGIDEMAGIRINQERGAHAKRQPGSDMNRNGKFLDNFLKLQTTIYTSGNRIVIIGIDYWIFKLG